MVHEEGGAPDAKEPGDSSQMGRYKKLSSWGKKPSKAGYFLRRRTSWLPRMAWDTQLESPGLALRPQAFFLDSQFGSFLIYGMKLRTELPFSAAITFLLGLQVSIGNQETVVLGKMKAGEGDDREWGCWVTSSTQWSWVWANSGR